jgi:hypothetical protein
MAAMNKAWPLAELGPVHRLRVLAGALPGTGAAELVIPAAYERVWATVSDLEQALPKLITDIKDCRVRSAEGDRLEMAVRGHLGQRATFEVVLRPGWCFMRSRLLVGGMAAVAEGDGTRLAFLGGSHLLGWTGPLAAHILQPHLERVLRRADRLVNAGGA